MDDPRETISALDAELARLQAETSSAAGNLTRKLAKALAQGDELDGLLNKLVLESANSSLNKALDPLYDTVGSFGESAVNTLFGALTGALQPANVVNVSVAAQDLPSFRQSETQLAATLSRVVSRGSRGA